MYVFPSTGSDQWSPCSGRFQSAGMYQCSIFWATWSSSCHQRSKCDHIFLLHFFGLHVRLQGGTAYQEKQVGANESKSVKEPQYTVFQIHIFLKLNSNEHCRSVLLIYGQSVARYTLVWCSGPSWWTLNPSTRIRIPVRASLTMLW